MSSESVDLSCIQKVSEEETAQGRLQFTTDNAALFSAIGTSCQVAGGTAWLWARPEAMNAVDVLFVDEASQISLANIIAVSQAAPRVVLLGDPQQLNQPTQGSHPEGTDVSALDHVLGGEQTIASDRGLFIEETWRLHPSICAFTSELFYEGRLRSRAGLELQEVHSSWPSCRCGPAISPGEPRRQPELLPRRGRCGARPRWGDPRRREPHGRIATGTIGP